MSCPKNDLFRLVNCSVAVLHQSFYTGRVSGNLPLETSLVLEVWWLMDTVLKCGGLMNTVLKCAGQRAVGSRITYLQLVLREGLSYRSQF